MSNDEYKYKVRCHARHVIRSNIKKISKIKIDRRAVNLEILSRSAFLNDGYFLALESAMKAEMEYFYASCQRGSVSPTKSDLFKYLDTVESLTSPETYMGRQSFQVSTTSHSLDVERILNPLAFISVYNKQSKKWETKESNHVN